MHTEKIRVDPIEPDVGSVSKAASYLQLGEVIVFPTETVYGLGGDALNVKAVGKIFKIKGRPQDNPLLLHVSSLEMAQRCASEDIARHSRLIDTLWPGPVTLIFRKSSEIPHFVTAGLDTVGIRFPAHPVARFLIELLGSPVAAPSANLSGKPSPTEEKHVIEDLDGLVPCMLLSGKAPLGLESTIIDLTETPPALLRPGPISPEQLQELLDDLTLAPSASDYRSSPKAPGMKYRHYSPDVDLVLIIGDLGKALAHSKKLSEGKKSVILCCEEHAKAFANIAPVRVLGSIHEPYGIALNLFGALRDLSKTGVDLAISESFPEKGIGLAIMNRLRKAASRIVE